MKSRRLNKDIPDNVSLLHKQVNIIIKKLYPNHIIYYEFPCYRLLDLYYKRNKNLSKSDYKVLRNKISKLHVDFYDKTAGIVIEVQGKQHTEFIEFFHNNLGGLDIQKRNDMNKRLLCNLIGINYIEIPYNTELNEETFLNLINYAKK